MLGGPGHSRLDPSSYRVLQLQRRAPRSATTRKPISKLPFLQPYFDSDYSDDQSGRIAQEIERYIKETRNIQKETPAFIEYIRNKIIVLHQYNLNVAQVALTYPLTNSLVQLLLRYLALECKVVYKQEYYTKKYEQDVQERIYKLLRTIYHAHFESTVDPSCNVSNECSNAMIDLFIRLKTDYDVTNKIVENIVVALLKKTENLSKVEDTRGRNPVYSTNADSADLRLVVTSDYGTDDFSPRSEGYDDVTQESDPDLTAQRKVIPTICIDDDDEKHTVCMEKECAPSERTVRQLRKKASRKEREDRVFASHKPIVDSVVIKEEVDGDSARCSLVNSVNKCVRSCDDSDSIVVSDDEPEQLLDERAKPLSADATIDDRSNNAKSSCRRGEVAMQMENKSHCVTGNASQTFRVIPTIYLEDDGNDVVRFEQESQPGKRTIRKLMAKSAKDGRAHDALDAHKPLVYGAPVKDESAKDNRDIDICDKSYVNSVNNDVQKPNSLEDDSSSAIDDSDEHYDENELFDEIFLDTDNHDKNLDDTPGTSLAAGRGEAKQNLTHYPSSSSRIANSEAKSSNKEVGTPKNSTNLSLTQKDEKTKRFKTVPIDLTADDDDNYPKSPKVEADAATNVNDKPAKRIQHEIGIFGDILEYEILNFPKDCHFDLTLDDEVDDARDDQDINHIFNELSSLIANDLQPVRDVNVEKHTKDVDKCSDRNNIVEQVEETLGFKNGDDLSEGVSSQTSLTLDAFKKQRHQQTVSKHQTALITVERICGDDHNPDQEELESSMIAKKSVLEPEQIVCENMMHHIASGDDTPLSKPKCKETDIRPSTSKGSHADLMAMPISTEFEDEDNQPVIQSCEKVVDTCENRQNKMQHIASGDVIPLSTPKCKETDIRPGTSESNDDDLMVTPISTAFEDEEKIVDTSLSPNTYRPIEKLFRDNVNILHQEEKVEDAPSSDQVLAEEEVVCDEDIEIPHNTTSLNDDSIHAPQGDVTNQSDNHLTHENSTTVDQYKSIHQVPEDREEVINNYEIDEELQATSDTTSQAIEGIEFIDKHLEQAQMIPQDAQASGTCRDNIERSTEKSDQCVQALTVHHILENSPSDVVESSEEAKGLEIESVISPLVSKELWDAAINEGVSEHRPTETIGVIVIPEPVHAESDVIIQLPVLSEEVGLSDEQDTDKQKFRILDDIPNKELPSAGDEKDSSKNLEAEEDSSERSGDHKVETILISDQRAEPLEASCNDIEDVTEKGSLKIQNYDSNQLPARIEEKYRSERPECHEVEPITMCQDVTNQGHAGVEDEKDIFEYTENCVVEKENFKHSGDQEIETHHETEEESLNILDDVCEKSVNLENRKDFSGYTEDREIETIPIINQTYQHPIKNKEEKYISQQDGSLETETISIPPTVLLDVTNNEHSKDLSDNSKNHEISEHSGDDGVEAGILVTKRNDIEVVNENESLNISEEVSSQPSTILVAEKNISEHSACHEFQTTFEHIKDLSDNSKDHEIERDISEHSQDDGVEVEISVTKRNDTEVVKENESLNILEDVSSRPSTRLLAGKNISEHEFQTTASFLQNTELVECSGCNVEAITDDVLRIEDEKYVIEQPKGIEVDEIECVDENQRLKIPGDVTNQELAINEDGKDMFEQSVVNKVESNELSATGCNDIKSISEKVVIRPEHSGGHKVENFTQDIGIIETSFNDVALTENESEKISIDVIDQESVRVEAGLDLPEVYGPEHTESNKMEKDVSEGNEAETILRFTDKNEKDNFEHNECHEIETPLIHQSAGLLEEVGHNGIEDPTKKDNLKIPDDVLSQKNTCGHAAEREVLNEVSEHSPDMVETILIPQSYQLGASSDDISRTKEARSVEHGDEFTEETERISVYNLIESTQVNDEIIPEDIGIAKVCSKTLVVEVESPAARHDDQPTGTTYLNQTHEAPVILGNQPNQELLIVSDLCVLEEQSEDVCDIHQESPTMKCESLEVTHDDGIIASMSSSHGIDTHPILCERVVEIVENPPTPASITLEEHVFENKLEGTEMANEDINSDVCEDQEIQENKVTQTINQSEELFEVVHKNCHAPGVGIDTENIETTPSPELSKNGYESGGVSSQISLTIETLGKELNQQTPLVTVECENIETTPIPELSKHEFEAVYSVEQNNGNLTEPALSEIQENEAISSYVKPLGGTSELPASESDKRYVENTNNGNVDLEILEDIYEEDGGAKSKNSVAKTLFVKLEQMTEFPSRNKSTPQLSGAESEDTVYLFVHHDQTNTEQNEQISTEEQEVVAKPSDKYVIDESVTDEQTPINPPVHLDVASAHHTPLVYFENEDLRDDGIAHDLVVHNEEVVTETIFLYSDSYEKPKVDENVVQPSPSLELVSLPENNSLVLLANVAASQQLQTPSTSNAGRRRGRQSGRKKQQAGCATASRRRRPKQKYIPKAEDFANKRITRSALTKSTTETLETSLPVPHDFLTSSPSLFTRTTDKHYTHKPTDVSSNSEDTNDSESNNLYIDKEKDTFNELLSVYDEDTLDDIIIPAPRVLSIPDGDVNECELLDQMERMTEFEGVQEIRQSNVEAVEHVVAETELDFPNPSAVLAPRNLEFTTLFSQVPSPSEILNEVTHKPFRTMAQRKEYYKLNPYVSIERLNMKCVESQKVHLRNARSRSLDINWLRSVKSADTPTKDYGNFDLDALHYDERNTQNELTSEKINIDYTKDVEENKGESDIGKIETVRKNSDDHLPLASLKMKLDESSLDDDFDEVPLLERLKVKTEVSQSSTQETDIVVKAEKHQEVHDTTDATPCQTISSVSCTEPSLETDSNYGNISKIHVDKENELKKTHSTNINDMESPNWKYYTAPKLRQKSISKDSLNRLVSIQNEPTSSCTKEKLETTNTAGNPTKTATDEKYLLLPKLRRKSLLETTELAKDATKKKPKTVDLLTKCKNTVSPIAEKLKRKLENDKIFQTEGVPPINDINTTPKSTRSGLRENLLEDNTESLESPKKAIVVKQIKGPIKKNIGRFLEVENQLLKKTEDNVEEPLTQPIFNKTFEENHEINSNDTHIRIPDTPKSTKRNRSYQSETLDAAVQNLDNPMSVETGAVKESTHSNNISIPSTSNPCIIRTEGTNTENAICMTEEINTDQETNDSIDTNEVPNSSIISEINVGASTSEFTSSETIPHGGKSKRSKTKALSNFAKKMNRLNLFHSHLSILDKSKRSKTIERRESVKSERQCQEGNLKHKTAENSEEFLITNTKTKERYTSRSDGSVEKDIKSMTTSKKVSSNKRNNTNKKSLDVSRSKQGSRRSRSRSSTTDNDLEVKDCTTVPTKNGKRKRSELAKSLIPENVSSDFIDDRNSGEATSQTHSSEARTEKSENPAGAIEQPLKKRPGRPKSNKPTPERNADSSQQAVVGDLVVSKLQFQTTSSTIKNEGTQKKRPGRPKSIKPLPHTDNSRNVAEDLGVTAKASSEKIKKTSKKSLGTSKSTKTSPEPNLDIGLKRIEVEAETTCENQPRTSKENNHNYRKDSSVTTSSMVCEVATLETDNSKDVPSVDCSDIETPKKRPGRPKSVKSSIDENTAELVVEPVATAEIPSEVCKQIPNKRLIRSNSVKPLPEENDSFSVITDLEPTKIPFKAEKVGVASDSSVTHKKRPGRPKSTKPSSVSNVNVGLEVADNLELTKSTLETCKGTEKKHLGSGTPSHENNSNCVEDLESFNIPFTTLEAKKNEKKIETSKKRTGRYKSAKSSIEDGNVVLEAENVTSGEVKTCKQFSKKCPSRSKSTKLHPEESDERCSITVADLEVTGVSTTTLPQILCMEPENSSEIYKDARKRKASRPKSIKRLDVENTDDCANIVNDSEVTDTSGQLKVIKDDSIPEDNSETLKKPCKKRPGRPKSIKSTLERVDKVGHLTELIEVPVIITEGINNNDIKISSESSEFCKPTPNKYPDPEQRIMSCSEVSPDLGVVNSVSITQFEKMGDVNVTLTEDSSEICETTSKKRWGRPKSVRVSSEQNNDECFGVVDDSAVTVTSDLTSPCETNNSEAENGEGDVKLSAGSFGERKKRSRRSKSVKLSINQNCDDLLRDVDDIETSDNTFSNKKSETINSENGEDVELSTDFCEFSAERKKRFIRSIKLPSEQNYDNCLRVVEDSGVTMTSDLNSSNKPCEIDHLEADNIESRIELSAKSPEERRKRAGRSKSVKLPLVKNEDDSLRIVENLGVTSSLNPTPLNNPSERNDSEAENGKVDITSSTGSSGSSGERKKRSGRSKYVKLSSGESIEDYLQLKEDLDVRVTSDRTSPNKLCEIVNLETENGDGNIKLTGNSPGKSKKRSGRSNSIEDRSEAIAVNVTSDFTSPNKQCESISTDFSESFKSLPERPKSVKLPLDQSNDDCLGVVDDLEIPAITDLTSTNKPCETISLEATDDENNIKISANASRNFKKQSGRSNSVPPSPEPNHDCRMEVVKDLGVSVTSNNTSPNKTRETVILDAAKISLELNLDGRLGVVDDLKVLSTSDSSSSSKPAEAADLYTVNDDGDGKLSADSFPASIEHSNLSKSGNPCVEQNCDNSLGDIGDSEVTLTSALTSPYKSCENIYLKADNSKLCVNSSKVLKKRLSRSKSVCYRFDENLEDIEKPDKLDAANRDTKTYTSTSRSCRKRTGRAKSAKLYPKQNVKNCSQGADDLVVTATSDMSSLNKLFETVTLVEGNNDGDVRIYTNTSAAHKNCLNERSSVKQLLKQINDVGLENSDELKGLTPIDVNVDIQNSDNKSKEDQSKSTEAPEDSGIALASDLSMSNKSVETVRLDGNKQIRSYVSVNNKDALDASDFGECLPIQNDKDVHILDNMGVSLEKQVKFDIVDAKPDAINKIASDTTGTCKKRSGRFKTVKHSTDVDKSSTMVTKSVILDVGTVDGGFNLSAGSSRLYKKRHGRSKSFKPSPKQDDGKCIENAEVPIISDTAISGKHVEPNLNSQIDEAEDSSTSIATVNQKNDGDMQDVIDTTSTDIGLDAVSLETGNDDRDSKISVDADTSQLEDLKVIEDSEMSVVGQLESKKSPLNDFNKCCSDIANVDETVISNTVSSDGDGILPQSNEHHLDRNNDSKVADNSEVTGNSDMACSKIPSETKTLSNFSKKKQSLKKRSNKHQSVEQISADNISFSENTLKEENHDDKLSIALDIEPSAKTDVVVEENVNAKKIFEEVPKELQDPIDSNVAEGLEVNVPDMTLKTDMFSSKSQFENSIISKNDEVAVAFEIHEKPLKKHADNSQVTEASETSPVDVVCDNIPCSKVEDQSVQENYYNSPNDETIQDKSIHLKNNITLNEETTNRKRKLDTNSSLPQFYDVLMESSTAKRNKYEEVTIDTDLVNQKVHKSHSPLTVSPGRREKKRLESIINELKENTCIDRSEKHESLDVPIFKEKLVEKINTPDSDSDRAIESGRDVPKNDTELVLNNPQILSSESNSTNIFSSTTSKPSEEHLSIYNDSEVKLPSLTMDKKYPVDSKSNTTESETSPDDKILQKSSITDDQCTDLSDTTETDLDSNGHSINFGNLVVTSDDGGILSKVITITSADSLISPTTSTYSFKNDGHILREPKDVVETAEAQVNPDADLSLDFSDISPIKMFIARDGPLDLISSNNFINDVDYPQSSRECSHSESNNEAHDDSDHLGGPLLNGKTEDKDLFPSYNQPTNVSNVFPFTFSQLLDVGEYNEINPEEILEILDAKLEPATSHDNENAAKNLTPPAQPTAESNQIGLTNYNLAELECKLIETTDSEDNINCKESDFAPRTDTWSHFFANDCSQQKVIVIHNEQYPVPLGNDMEPYATTYIPEIHDRKDTTVLPLEEVKRSKLEGEKLSQSKQKPQSTRTNGLVRRNSVIDKPLTRSDDSAHVVTEKSNPTRNAIQSPSEQPQPENEPTRAVLMSSKLDQNKRPASTIECMNIFDKIKLYKRGAKKVEAPVSVDNAPAKPRTRKKPGRPKNPPPEVSEPAQSPKLQTAKPKNEKYEILNTDNLLKLKMKPINRKQQQNTTNDSKYSNSYSMDNILKKDPVDREETDGKRGDKSNEKNGLVVKRALPAGDHGEPSSSKQRKVEDNHGKSNKDQLFDRLVEQGNLNSVCSLMVTKDNKLKLVRERRPSFSRNNGATYERRGDTTRWGRHRNEETSRPYPATYQSHEKKYQNNNVSSSSRGRPQSLYAPASGRYSENSSSSRGWRSYYKPTSVRTGYVPDNKGPFDKSARAAEERLSGTNDLNNDDACYKKYDHFCPAPQPYSDRNARSSQARLPAKNDNKKEDTWYKKFDDFYPSHRYAYGFDKPHRNESK